MQQVSGALERVRRASTARGRQQQGLYLLEGVRLLKRALAANVELTELLVSELAASTQVAAADAREVLALAEERGIKIQRVPHEALMALAAGRHSGEWLGLARMPPRLEISEALQGLASGPPSLLLVLCDIAEPGNVGALMRTALASDATLLLSIGQTDPFHPKAVRTSMGALFKLRHCSVASSAEALSTLRAAKVRQYAAVATQGQPLSQVQALEQAAALYVGNEATGLPAHVSLEVDLCLTIPMPQGVDSFSVNAATAVVLYQLNRARCAF